MGGPFVMPVVDKYKDMGMVVMGKVEAGEAKKGQSLLLMPNRVSGSVLQVSSCHRSKFTGFYFQTRMGARIIELRILGLLEWGCPFARIVTELGHEGFQILSDSSVIQQCSITYRH
jgi:hypothetical protein